jgi:hypothetical protein
VNPLTLHTPLARLVCVCAMGQASGLVVGAVGGDGEEEDDPPTPGSIQVVTEGRWLPLKPLCIIIVCS